MPYFINCTNISGGTLTRRILSAILLLILCGVSWGQSGIWIEVRGEADLASYALPAAAQKALENARRAAVEQVCGVNLQTSSLTQEFILKGDMVSAASYGKVVKEEILEWKTLTVQKEAADIPSIILQVRMKALVEREAGQSDPAFKVKLDLNRSIYQSGEEMIIKARATQDCYLTVLNVTSQNEVIVLFPNKIHSNNFIKAGEDFVFPSGKDNALGIHLNVSVPPGEKECSEIIWVIASKDSIDFAGEIEIEGDYGFLPTLKTALETLNRWLVNIPLDRRTEAKSLYRVVG